jgi:hypothetical protein
MSDQNQRISIVKDAESSSIDKLSIVSNKTGSIVDLSNGTNNLYYYESVLQETIKVSFTFADTGNSVSDGGSLKSVLEGLPIVGQEKVDLKMTDNLGNQLSIPLYVNKINPLHNDTRKSLIGLDLSSKEYILNEQVRSITRFDGKISDHIKRILTDSKLLDSKKKLDIEETANNYNFIGNNRKPFYICTWLSKKSIPNIQNAKGNTAGYFFFETSKGFHFKSIDSLLSQKPVKKYVFNQTPDARGQNIPEGYDGKILEYSLDNTINLKDKLEIGAYSTKIVLFDPFNCYYEVQFPRAEESEKNLKLAAKELPTFNNEFPNRFTRTTYMLVDKGVLPSGSTKQQIEKSREENFDPKNILNQSTMRYNQLFTVRTSVVIPGDFSLHAGDVIEIETPELSNKKTQDRSKQFGGIYMIADLCHYVTTRSTFTKLNLVRDSYGRKPSTSIPL